jgi:hypothetical protein
MATMAPSLKPTILETTRPIVSMAGSDRVARHRVEVDRPVGRGSAVKALPFRHVDPVSFRTQARQTLAEHFDRVRTHCR